MFHCLSELLTLCASILALRDDDTPSLPFPRKSPFVPQLSAASLHLNNDSASHSHFQTEQSHNFPAGIPFANPLGRCTRSRQSGIRAGYLGKVESGETSGSLIPEVGDSVGIGEPGSVDSGWDLSSAPRVGAVPGSVTGEEIWEITE